jgi:tRNA-dihydrouridine synthase
MMSGSEYLIPAFFYTTENPMRFYLAPMEGITGYVYRNAYYNCFGDMDCYFTPFIGNKKLCPRERRDVLPENNLARPLVPQILTNRAEDFLQISETLQRLGYTQVNLNLGCPSGTVTARGRGAGFLAYPDELDAFLNEIFEKCPLEISVKTRIGVESPIEWERLLSIYQKYPIRELIIHPRLQRDFYKNTPNLEAFALACERLEMPLCYNGDIVSVQTYEDFRARFPDTERMMLGRGVLKKPWLVGSIRDGKRPDRAVLRRFHEEIVTGYQKEMNGERDVLFRLKEFWSYFGESFVGGEKLLKKIKKSSSLIEYQVVVRELFENCELAQ